MNYPALKRQLILTSRKIVKAHIQEETVIMLYQLNHVI